MNVWIITLLIFLTGYIIYLRILISMNKESIKDLKNINRTSMKPIKRSTQQKFSERFKKEKGHTKYQL